MCDIPAAVVVETVTPSSVNYDKLVAAVILRSVLKTMRTKFHLDDLTAVLVEARDMSGVWIYFLPNESKECPRLTSSVGQLEKFHEVCSHNRASIGEYVANIGELSDFAKQYTSTSDDVLKQQIEHVAGKLSQKTRARYPSTE